MTVTVLAYNGLRISQCLCNINSKYKDKTYSSGQTIVLSNVILDWYIIQHGIEKPFRIKGF